ncbi:MAG: LamG domain-containing protein [Myxococcota bacterium]|jgi:hypothetical protein|nr:LamG domain-containing protein [Myxococcota bacterium]
MREGRLRLVGFVVALVGACVDAELTDLPCPCATEFVCVEGRCVHVRDLDAATGFVDARAQPSDSGSEEVDDGDADRTPAELLEWRFESGAFDLSSSPECTDAAGALRIAGGAGSCAYLSRVVDAERVVRVKALSWMPRGPYAKPLPAGGVVERYARDGADMTGAVVVLRMDEGTTVPVDAPLRDVSGRGHDCIVRGSASAESTDGPLGVAMVLGRRTRCELPAGRTPDLQMDTSDFTWVAWFRSSEAAETFPNNRILLGGESIEPADPHVWFGINEGCNGAAPGATLGGSMRSAGGGDTASYCGTSVVNDGRWHFGALAKRGHSVATLDLFSDGVREGRFDAQFTGPISFRDPDDAWNVASFRDGGFETTMGVADLAIFKRALSDAEVRALYRRVALRARVQLRVCETPDCSDATFGSSAFLDPATNEASPVHHEVDLLGRFLQLRVTLESDLPGESPEIEWFQIEADES